LNLKNVDFFTGRKNNWDSLNRLARSHINLVFNLCDTEIVLMYFNGEKKIQSQKTGKKKAFFGSGGIFIEIRGKVRRIAEQFI
jgi:hypothetical protein